MPRLTAATPKYRLYRASGQAVVTDCYLGPWKSKASKIEYDRIVGEWLAAGRPSQVVEQHEVTVVEVCVRFFRWAKDYYPKNGRPTGTDENYKSALAGLSRGMASAPPRSSDR